MGTIKFEIDLPEFDKELSINITIHRDGEVVYSTTSSPSMGSKVLEDMSKKNEERPMLVETRGLVNSTSSTVDPGIKESKPKKSSKKPISGNFMDLDI